MVKQLNNPQTSTVYPVTEEWLCDSEEEVETLPESTPPGSYAMYKDDEDKIRAKLKMPSGNWVDF